MTSRPNRDRIRFGRFHGLRLPGDPCDEGEAEEGQQGENEGVADVERQVARVGIQQDAQRQRQDGQEDPENEKARVADEGFFVIAVFQGVLHGGHGSADGGMVRLVHREGVVKSHEGVNGHPLFGVEGVEIGFRPRRRK
jgi:hypothetical protein